jgi:hypothetical protein
MSALVCQKLKHEHATYVCPSYVFQDETRLLCFQTFLNTSNKSQHTLIRSDDSIPEWQSSEKAIRIRFVISADFGNGIDIGSISYGSFSLRTFMRVDLRKRPETRVDVRRRDIGLRVQHSLLFTGVLTEF